MPPNTSPAAALHSALRLPRTSPEVASWLFPDDPDSPFRNATTLSPSLFQRALTLVSKSHFTPFCTAPPSVAKASPTENYFLVLIPLQTTDSVTLGFTFHVGLPAADSLFPLADVLPSKFALVGRFAYDRLQHQLLIFIKDFTNNYSHLGLVERTPTKGRRLQFLSLPKKPFSASQLPKDAAGVTVLSQALREPPPIHTPSQPPRQEPTNEAESFRSSNCKNPLAAARCEAPLRIRQERDSTIVATRVCPTKSTTENNHIRLSASPAALDPLSLTRSLSELRACMTGQFVECTITRDVPSTPDLSCPVTVGLYRSFTRPAEGEEAEMLQKLAARTYYASALSVSNDMRLIAEKQEEEEDQDDVCNGR